MREFYSFSPSGGEGRDEGVVRIKAWIQITITASTNHKSLVPSDLTSGTLITNINLLY
jgi:hypothetical protein